MKNEILEKLLYEFSHHIRNELYSMCQFKLATRSNQIEGNTMDEDATAMLFDTQQIPSSKYMAKEIEEAQGHFLMFNAMLKSIDKPLDIDIIKSYHKEMTEGIFEFKANGGVPGEFKVRDNIAGTMPTVSFDKVEEELKKLLDLYNDKKEHNIEDIILFHSRYEHIHPFQDYNGRTGRMILFRESLLHGKPIVVDQIDRLKYIQSIKDVLENNSVSDDVKHLYEKWQDEFYREIEKCV